MDDDLELCSTDGDFVEVYDGPNALAPALGTFCADATPPVQVSSTDTMSIKLLTDGSVQTRGFQLTWIFVGESFA